MAGSAGGDLDFSTLSLKDLIEARDLYHFHLMSKANVVGTAAGKASQRPGLSCPSGFICQTGAPSRSAPCWHRQYRYPKRRAWSRGTPPASLHARFGRLRSGLAPIGAGTDKQADW